MVHGLEADCLRALPASGWRSTSEVGDAAFASMVKASRSVRSATALTHLKALQVRGLVERDPGKTGPLLWRRTAAGNKALG